MQAKKQDDLVVFEWFKTYVLDSKLETSIGHEELVSDSDLGSCHFFLCNFENSNFS